jgi:hypothetical protein
MSDGLDLGGVRQVEIAVPQAPTRAGDCERVALPVTAATISGSAFRLPPHAPTARRTGDPRLSLEERYPTHDRYVAQVTRATQALVEQRFLLQEDADRYIPGRAAREPSPIDQLTDISKS